MEKSTLEVVKAGKVLDTLELAELLLCKGGSFTFGRGVDNDVRMDHPSCSRVHAAVLWKAGNLLLKDLRSTHGTVLRRGDGPTVPLKPGIPQTIEDGDVFQLGASSREFRFLHVGKLAEEMQKSPWKSVPLHKQLEERLDLGNKQNAPAIEQAVDQQSLAAGKENEAPPAASPVRKKPEKPDTQEDCPSAKKKTKPSSASCSPRELPAEEDKKAEATCAKPVDAGKAKPKPKSWVLIIDSNILLDQVCFSKLKGIMQLVSQRRPDVVRVVIPRIVLREMDKMNHGQVPLHLKNQIRLALCMLEEEQNSAAGRPTIIHMQAKDEPQLDDATFFKEHAREYYYHHNDDFLIEAAHFFATKAVFSEDREQISVMVTNDRALRIRARSEGLHAHDGKDALVNLIRQCELTSSGKLGPATLPPTSVVSAPCF